MKPAQVIDSSVSTDGARKFLCLDGMRGIAAISVVVLHAQMIISPLVAPTGALAVDFFFVLSGFIIAHAYENRIRSGLGIVEFMKIRLIRLYPLYLLGTFVGISYFIVWRLYSFGTGTLFAACGVLFIPLFRPDAPFGPYPFDPPAWSLIFEILVNLLYVIVFPLLTMRRLLAVIGAALAGLVWSGWLGGSLHGVAAWADVFGGSCRTIASFGSGLIVYRLRGIRPLSVHPLLVLLFCAAIFCADTSGSASAIIRFLMIFPLMPFLVWLGSANEPSRRFSGLFNFLGVTSYAIYVLHWPVLLTTLGLLGALKFDASAYHPWSGIVFIVALVAAAALVDRYYDAPVRKLLSKVLLKPREVSRAGQGAG